MKKQVASLRKEYKRGALTEKTAEPNPFRQFEKWWKEAVKSVPEEVNAMTVATATKDGTPSARIMLLKDFSEKGFVFFTNYQSRKGLELEENPKACLVFFWKELERQVRISGRVQKTSTQISDDYFYSRPFLSQLGAVASPQSRIIRNRKWLEERFQKVRESLKKQMLKRPDHWGGYILKPDSFEFWQGRPGRLHDRLLYTLSENGKWKRVRLAP
ncbi:MAG: pyridoxamine 5'-phosphate oxidase [Chitinophagaceae bacterium]|nr:pyridoxamine 5'-phosphate oxidase [Chitinophagaceae bacterium]